MGGLQAAPLPQQQTPEDFAALWKKIQEENERKRKMAMNEIPGLLRSQPDSGEAVSRVLQQLGGF